MDSGTISKIQKAKQYAEERDRVKFERFSVTFDGTNNPHTVHFKDGEWTCDCSYFQSRDWCSHTRALEIILEGMLPE